MQPNEVGVRLEVLENRLKRLIEQFVYLKEELREVKNENDVLRHQLDQKNEELKNFQNQFKISKIANVVADDNNHSAELKQKINEYIKEIEKGLSYLNRA
jgi:hypothetical protein